MNRFRPVGTVSLCLVVALVAGLSSAEPGAQDPPLLPDRVREALQDRNYPAAQRAIREAAAAKDAQAERLAFLAGWALCLDKQYDAAVAALDKAAAAAPNGTWARAARFAAGWALAQKGDFRAAAERYRREVEPLLAPERAHEFARLYLELADAAFRPAEPDEKPDWAKALEFYRQALGVGVEPARRVAVQLLAGRCEQESRQFDRAIRTYQGIVEQQPADPLALEAGYRLGECHLAARHEQEARRVWQDLLAAHGGAGDDRLAEAAYRLSETWHLPQPESDAALHQGVASLARFLERFPDHKLAGAARLRVAESYLHRQRYAEAVEALTAIVSDKRFQSEAVAPQARRLLGRAYQLQRKYSEALAAWRDYLAKHPAHEAWNEVQAEIVRTEYLIGVGHYAERQYAAARRALDEFSARYPLDPRNPGLMYLFGQMEHQQQRFEEAIDQWRRLVAKYPKSDEASQAQFRIARTLEEDLAEPEKALEEYRKTPLGTGNSDARERADRLLAASMTLRTERVFRTAEVPAVRLTTRNVESVSVRLYKVDLETYFRKMHTTEGVERLDVALIEPDARREQKIADFRKYQECQSRIEVPLPDGARRGALVVSVASPDLEAGSLVIQSDLEVIAKCSPEEVFVFAEDMPRGKPWPGARILVSDGARIVAEGTTGADGVFRRKLTGHNLKRAAVFASAEGHVAATTLTLSGFAAARSLSDKGYIYSDRPVYRPGDTVRVAGCIRRAAGDRHVVDAGAPFTLEVIGADNRSLWWQPVRLDAFGAFHAEFPLPQASEPGDYRVVLYDRPKHLFEGAFRVAEALAESVRVEIDVPRRVYYRGEPIEGLIRARYVHGTPLAGRAIVYSLAAGAKHTAVTDARGEVRFKLSTRDFGETQTLPFHARLSEEGAEGAVNFLLACQGFTVKLQAARSAVLAGETFELSVSTVDAEGKPAAQALRLVVEEQTTVEGRVTRRLRQTLALATPAGSGVVRQTLKLDQAGQYLLRAEGLDRFGTPVSAEIPLEVSGNDDVVRLRILADRHTFEAGQTATFQLHWRDAPALALVACEAGTVLDYRLVELRTGANPLALPLVADLAPNFQLSAAVMSDAARGRFHHASAPIVVRRRLNVTMDRHRAGADPKTPLRPGDEMEVAVRTADPAGKPVAARLSLAMLPRDLLDRFPWPRPPIGDFFAGAARGVEMRTASSAGFACDSSASPINSRVLAEQERHARSSAEEASRRGAGFARGRDPFGLPAASQETAGGDDFDSLIELITITVNGTPRPFVRPRDEAGRSQEQLPVKPKIEEGVPEPLPSLPDLAATAYWNPAIATDAAGRATIRFRLPDDAATWTLVARAITVDTLAGEALGTLTLAKPLSGELKLPAVLVEGDQLQLPVLVHNDLLEKGRIDLALTVRYAGAETVQTKSLDVTAKGTRETSFPVESRRAEGAPPDDGHAVFELALRAGAVEQRVQRTVAVRPFAATVFATTGGSAAGDAAARLEPPPGVALERPRLQIVIGPSVERSLLDVLFGRPTWCESEAAAPADDVERAAADLMAALGIQRLLSLRREAQSELAGALDARVRRALGLLIAAQGEDGGWSWGRRRDKTDRDQTSRVLWGLSLARVGGYTVPDDHFDAARESLRKQAAALANSDARGKAVVLHALAAAGDGDFAVANHLYRQRAALAPAALAHLALAMVEMDRRAMAGELLALLAQKQPGDDAEHGCTGSPIEVQALEVLGAQIVQPGAARTRELVERLLAQRSGHRWLPDPATGPATLALCAWFAAAPAEASTYRLAIDVNGTALAPFQLAPGAPTRVIDVPAALVKPGKQEIRLRMIGRGRYAYQCVLGGLVPADRLPNTASGLSVERTCEPAPLEIDGRVIPRGFELLEHPGQPLRNPLSQLPVGKRGVVELRVKRLGLAPDVPADRLEYLVVTEPVPAGVRVLESSIRGGFERYAVTPGALVFYVGNRRDVAPISYEICGWLPGRYRAGPTVVRDAYRPAAMTASRPVELAVLPAGATGADPYRLTPREHLELGRRLFGKGDYGAAREHLAELVEKYTLRTTIARDAVRMLLEIHLQLGPAAKVVQYCEMLKEKWPDEQIAFGKIARVAAAYAEMGEHERAYLVYRAAAEGNFQRESAVAGVLDGQGEFLRGVATMARLLGEYPPEPYVTAAQFGLSQTLAAKAPQAADDPRLREAKVNRVDLLLRSWTMLEDLLAMQPEDPGADQVAFAAAGVLLELDRPADAAEACGRYARRYPQSGLLDSFWYVTGYGRFAAGQTQEAIDMCRRVDEFKPVDTKTGQAAESANKWPAVYILGQIYHSLGRPADAVREYRRVENRFPDARRSIDDFLRKAIALPETSVFRPGEPVELELKFRNLAACDVKVYRIDLMKFGLLEQGLDRITHINLAGIRPQHEATVTLGDGRDYRDRGQKLALPLAKEGAYLVVCRGEDLHASGLVLVSPLAIEVREDPGAGQVRTTVRDAVADRCAAKVQVRVIGAGNEDFVAGVTDLRGVFTAERIHGAATVIALAPPARYAFYRGTGPALRPDEVPPRAGRLWPPPSAASQQASPPGAAPVAEDADRAAVERVRAALAERTVMDFVETPLAEVVKRLGARHRIEIQIDKKALDDVGVQADTPVTRSLSGVKLRSALRLMLRELDLTFTTTDGVLLITTPEQADARLETVVYPVADLVTCVDRSGQQWADFDSLIDTVTSTVKPTCWDTVGGPGSVKGLESTGTVVVSQTEDVHQEIAALLANLRRARGQGGQKTPVRDRPTAVDGMGGGINGMGGFGGGMGMAGGMGGIDSTRAEAQQQAAPARTPDLLEGVQQFNRRVQGREVERLQKMYQGGKGMGGVGVGGAF